MIKPLPNWRDIVRFAWSWRLMAVAVALSVLEVGLPFFSDKLPHGLFAALSGLITVGAMVARVVAQKRLSDG